MSLDSGEEAIVRITLEHNPDIQKLKGLEFCQAFQNFWRMTHKQDFQFVNKEKLQYQGLMVKLLKHVQNEDREVRTSMIDQTLQKLGLSRSRERLPNMQKLTVKQDVKLDASTVSGFGMMRNDSGVSLSMSQEFDTSAIRNKKLRRLLEEKTISVEDMRREHLPEDGYHIISFKDEKANKRSIREPELVNFSRPPV